MFTYLKTNRYFGQIAQGLEEIGREELAELQAGDIKATHRGLYFSVDKAGLYRINYLSRVFTKILAPLLTFDCHSTKYLYKTALNIDWSELMSVDDTFSISANVVHSHITHSQYASLCLKDAIVDQFRQRFDTRPNVDSDHPDFRFHLHIQNNQATIYLDTSGGSLHRRGYRLASVVAPMQETVAAAIIRLSGWDGETPFVDPMCGSGTLLAEAMMHYCRIPAGYNRTVFGFLRLPDFEEALWLKVKKEADLAIRPLPPGLINGSDVDGEAVAASRQNCLSLPGGDHINLTIQSFQQIAAQENCTIVTNPPYGLRLGGKETEGIIKELGDFLKQRCKGSTAYIYFGNRELLKKVGLRPTWKKPLASGGLDGRLAKYEMY